MDDKVIDFFTRVNALAEPDRTNIICFAQYLVGHARVAELMLQSDDDLASILTEPPTQYILLPLN